jgi:predicted phosphate transport protein (TIGR00153 family)
VLSSADEDCGAGRARNADAVIACRVLFPADLLQPRHTRGCFHTPIETVGEVRGAGGKHQLRDLFCIEASAQRIEIGRLRFSAVSLRIGTSTSPKGIIVRLIPRDEKFYDLFRDQAENIHAAARALEALFHDYRDVEKRVAEIKFMEHKGDQITHSLMMKLNKTFITPIDREDIHALGSALDDVLDLVDAAASRLVIYKVKAVTPGAQQLARVISHGTEIIVKAIAQLSRPQNMLEYCEQLTLLEEEADRIKGECIARLFEDSGDPIEVIKWKEIYEVLEASTDKCEDVADVLEAVVLKAA